MTLATRIQQALLSAAIVFVAAGGCKSDKAEAPDAPGAAAGESGAADKPPPSARAGLTPHRPLLEEVARAELRSGGIVVDFGTSDERKYTRGGWATGWSASPSGEPDGTSPFSVVSGQKAQLHFVADGPAKELVLRARATGGDHRVAVKANGKAAANFAVTGEWTEIRAPLNNVAPGRLVLDLERSKADGELRVDWVKLADESGLDAAAPVPRMVPINIGGKVRRALAAPTNRTYSFYLHVPAKASLVFDVGAKTPVKFAVTAYDVDDGDAHDLYSGAATPGAWTEQAVDLASFAGRAIRLDFTTSGGELTAAGWGEPTIYTAKEAQTAAPLGAKPPKNVVFVVMDTTRADAFTPHYPNNAIKTPVFDKLAAQSTAFANAYNNENWTKPSVATMFSGLYPTTHTARTAVAHLPDEVRFFTENLQAKGFETAAFSANAVFNAKFGFNRGWDSFNNLSDDAKEGNGYYLYRRAARWLDERADKDRPFFVYVQSVDPHITYDVPEDYTSLYFDGAYRGKLGNSFDRDEQVEVDRWALRLDDRDLSWVRALYWGEVTYQDEQLGVLLDKLDELGVADDTMVIVTNDHGEELFEHKHMGHGWTLYDEMIRAPLVIRYPRMFKPGRVITDIVEHVDLAPTILAAVGAPPMKDIEGTSFLDVATGAAPSQIRPLYSVASSRKRERSIRVGRYKLITDDDKDWRGLYDVVDDPGETKDLRKAAVLAGRLAEVYLAEGLAVPDKRSRLQNVARVRKLPARDAEIDPVLRKKLEALGYL